MAPAPGAAPRGRLVGTNRPLSVDDTHADELGDRVHEAGPAEPDGLHVADDLEVQPVVVDRHDLDGAGGRAHAAPDRRGLEGGPRGSRGGQQSLAVAKDDLAVGADVDEQPESLVPVHPGGEDAGDDVATDVRAEGREHRRAGTGLSAKPSRWPAASGRTRSAR